MNWGYKVILILTCFVGLIVSLVVICINQKDIFLVSKNYYEKEIMYQDQIDLVTNTMELREKPGIRYNQESQNVVVSFPSNFQKEGIIGTIFFYRPSDATMDFSHPIRLLEQGQQVISTQSLKQGLWKIEIAWTLENESYFLEERLVVK